MPLSSKREISAFTQKSFKIFSYRNAFGNFFNLFNGGSDWASKATPSPGVRLHSSS